MSSPPVMPPHAALALLLSLATLTAPAIAADSEWREIPA